MTNGWEKYRLQDFIIEDIYEDPTTDYDWNITIRAALKRKRFSDQHVELILKNSKICNWPEKFKSKELIKRNKREFQQLIGKFIS